MLLQDAKTVLEAIARSGVSREAVVDFFRCFVARWPSHLLSAKAVYRQCFQDDFDERPVATAQRPDI